MGNEQADRLAKQGATIPAVPQNWQLLGNYHAHQIFKRWVKEKICSEQGKHDVLKDGMPYTRSHLFHCPPGTGKFSLTLSAGGSFELDVYVVNLACANDSSLLKMLSALPPRCVVLLEDVDAAGMTHSGG